VFDELFVRHWDTWRIPGKVWTVGSVNLETGKYTDHLNKELVRASRRSLLKYQSMDAPAYTLSPTHIAVTVKPAHLNDATHTRTDIYLISGSVRHITPHAHGAISSARFDRTGHKLAWLEMAEDGYEADQNRVQVRSSKSGKWDDVVLERMEAWEKSPTVLEVRFCWT
jgi:hypothetical protein